jgi:hypothetical protein
MKTTVHKLTCPTSRNDYMHALSVWPGVRRAGLRRLSGGADAGPGAAQRRRLI